MHPGNNAGGFFPPGTDDPVRMALGPRFHHPDNLLRANGRGMIKNRFQKALGPGYLAFLNGDIIKLRIGVDAHAAEKKENRFFEIVNAGKRFFQGVGVLTRPAQQKIMRDMQSRINCGLMRRKHMAALIWLAVRRQDGI